MTSCSHSWKGTAIGNVDNPLGASWVPIVFGLGFVLSFGYWTTNFAEVQRALSAKSLSAARRTPLIGAFPKIFIPAVTIIPGLVALAVIPGLGGDDPDKEYNNAIPLLMNEYLPNGMLGIALVGLLAAFMAGVAANVSAFNTVVTYDLWEPYVSPARATSTTSASAVSRRSGHRDRHRDRPDRLGLQQHHGLHPAVVLLLQRAVVRDVHHRHVLEADDAVGRPLGPRRGHRSAPPWRTTGTAGASSTSGPPQAAAFWGAIAAFVADAVVTVIVSMFTTAQADRGAPRARPRHGQRRRGPVRRRTQAWYRQPLLLGVSSSA